VVLIILKLIATSSFLAALKCKKIVLSGAALSAPPNSPAGLRGRTYNGGEIGKREKNGKGREREDRPLPFEIR